MKKLLSIAIIAVLAGCSSMGMSGGAGGMSGGGFNSTGYPATNAPFDANDPYHGG